MQKTQYKLQVLSNLNVHMDGNPVTLGEFSTKTGKEKTTNEQGENPNSSCAFVFVLKGFLYLSIQQATLKACI